MKISKLLVAAVSAVSVVMAASAAAATWPTKPVRVIVPFAPGGNVDVAARVLGTQLASSLGQPFVVENRAGAGGSIATQYVASAPADGTVILTATSGSLAAGPAVNPAIKYDPAKDFAPIGLIVRAPLAVAVSPKLPVTTIAELKAFAQKENRPISIGSSGAGGSQHLALVEFANRVGIPFVHVPYQGGAALMPDLVSGNIDITLNELPNVIALHRDNKVRIIALASAERTPLLPNVPTVIESGYPGFTAATSNGWLAPAGTPPEVTQTLSRELIRLLGTPAIHKQLQDLGLVVSKPEEITPAFYGELIRDELDRARRTARQINLKGTE